MLFPSVLQASCALALAVGVQAVPAISPSSSTPTSSTMRSSSTGSSSTLSTATSSTLSSSRTSSGTANSLSSFKTSSAATNSLSLKLGQYGVAKNEVVNTGNGGTTSGTASTVTPPYPSTSNSGTGATSGTGSTAAGTGRTGPSPPYPSTSKYGTAGTGGTAGGTGQNGQTAPYPISTGGTGSAGGTAGSTGGTKSMVTGTGSATSKTASSTVASSSNSWQNDQCTTPQITDATVDPEKRWDSVDASDAWNAAVSYAVGKQSSGSANGLTFPMLISNFFHGPEQMHCEQLDARSACGTEVLCVAPAAGFLILNSLESISNLNYNTWDAMGKGLTPVVAAAGSFSSTFAPMDDPNEGLKVLLDILGLGFALTVSPLWNAAFKAIPFFASRGNLLGTIKDWINPIVSNGITIVKDSSLSGAALNAQNSLSDNAQQMVDAWQTTVHQYNFDLFNGSSSSNNLLFQQIQNGQVLAADFSIDEGVVQNYMEKALFGVLAPQAWAYSNKDIHPFILDSGAACGTKDPIDSQYLATGTGDISWTCVDGTIYYLLSVSGSPIDCQESSNYGPAPCSEDTFDIPPGVTSLDGNNWGGLTRDDLTTGAVATYKANGNKNGGAEIDLDDSNALSDIGDLGIRAPGVIRIPVCSNAKDIHYNWQTAQTSLKYYPCSD